jgi:hypothetical protein
MEENKVRDEEIFEIVSNKKGIMININLVYAVEQDIEKQIQVGDKVDIGTIITVCERIQDLIKLKYNI